MLNRSSSLILCIFFTLVFSASAASNDDEPLSFLFNSFLPNAFLEKPVGGEGSRKSKGAAAVKDAKADELLKTAEKMMSGLNNIVAGLNAPDNGNCVYKCPNGAKPSPMPGFKPVPNGCGTHGLKVDVSDLPGITECCDQHDICYGTCDSGQLNCDRRFNSCMADACERLRSDGVITTKERFTECMGTGAAFHLTAMAVGCEFYRDAQRAACSCAGPAGSAGDEAELGRQAKIREYNNAKRAKEAAQPPDSSDDLLDNVDPSSPMFDLPDAIDRDEL